MKEYFLRKYMPELVDLPKKERDRLWQDNYSKGFSHWQPWMALALMIVWCIFLFWIIDYLRDEVFKQKHIIFNIAHSILGYGLGYTFFWITLSKKVRLHIRNARNK